jgi:RimJ/RimL family protein N-acetyltransferase
MTDFPVNPPLAEDVLARRSSLPLKPSPVVLEGQRFRLQPLDLARDVPPLFARSNGQAIQLGNRRIEAYDAEMLVWRYMAAGPFAEEAALSAWLEGQVKAPDVLPLAVYELASDSPIGVATLMSNSPAHLSIELGSIWYSPLAQRTGANTEATYLMLRHVFELGYRRVIWKCDALNARSRKAALRFGFQFEGIHEYHFIVKGRNRDTAWFRMLDKEWDTCRQMLEAELAAFD